MINYLVKTMDIKKVSSSAQLYDLKSKGSKSEGSKEPSIKQEQLSTIDIAGQTAIDDVVDIQKVEELKAKIQSGDYSFDFEGIAQAIVDLNG